MKKSNNSLQCLALLVEPSEHLWQEVSKDVISIEKEAFPNHPESPEELHKAFTNPEHTIVILKTYKNQVNRYMYAVPIDAYRPYHINERKENVLVDNVAIKKQYQGKGFVGIMTKVLEEGLKKKGFIFFELWANIPNGYADKVANVYKNRIVGEPKRADPAEDSSWGARRIFKIRLQN